jgi:hypothetical protein
VRRSAKSSLSKLESQSNWSLQGKPVHLVLHGDVTIKKPAPQKSLMFRLHTKKAKEILELKEIPRVHLTLEALHLRVNDTIIYERSIDRILLSRQHEDWMLQVSHDVQTLGRLIPAFDAPMLSRNGTEPSSARS